MRLYTRWKYGYRAEQFPLEKNRPYLILSNHHTGFDQFLIALSFKRPLYYIASDDLFNNRYSKLIEYLVAPIPKSKSSRDLESVRNCYRIAKEGGTICVFPEGNRTFSGTTETIDPSIAKLVRLLKLPVVFYRFEGGYGVQPRWSHKLRKGRMTGHVTGILEQEGYEALSDEALYAEICRRLYWDENESAAAFRSSRRAEYLERAFYYCPDCGGMGDWHSEGETAVCRHCGRTLRYTEHVSFEVLKGSPTLTTPKQWYDAQTAWCKNFDFTAAGEDELFGEDGVELHESVRCQRKIFLDAGRFRFFRDRLQIGESVFSLAEITDMTVLGKNKINFYARGKIFQLQPPPRFCGVRAVNFFYSYKLAQGENGHGNDEFMGL